MASFDIKKTVEDLVKKLKSDPALYKKFGVDPIKTVEKLIGIDLPDDKIKAVVAGIKAKLGADDLGSAVDKLKKLF